MSDDPFTVLGVRADATLSELAAARRRLAQSAHPDHGGDSASMQALNSAYEEALRRRNRPEAVHPLVPAPAPPPAPPPAPARGSRPARQLQHDSPSFVVDVAPDRAHEALLIAAASIGEVIVEDSPHLIECLLAEPQRCWCRLDLLPDGAMCVVSLTVAQYDDEPAPDIDEVRDAWIANLNQL